MKTQKTIKRPTRNQTLWKARACLLLLLGCFSHSYASTLVSGNVSGTWNKAGSPYMVIANCTVQGGQTLTIQPGVTVIIGENLEIDVFGQIQAIGTAAEPITVKGTSPTNRWTQIMVQYGGGPESEFRYCRFSDAAQALYLSAYGATVSMQTVVANCTFANCSTCGISGNAQASTYLYYSVVLGYSPTLDCSINNCRFSDCNNGCWFWIQGVEWYTGAGYAHAYAGANPNIANCVFEHISGTALGFSTGNWPASSSPTIVNCLMNQCTDGLQVWDPFDATIANCILDGCTNGVVRTGSLSTQVGHNCFFNNQTNFVGYPANYGKIVMANNNGTPCDIAFNIFQNPLFVDSTNYYLQNGSPCIDAGDPSAAYNDCLLGSPFSLGTVVNDMGPYGGPGACAWITAPVITSPPNSTSSCLGQSTAFSVEAAGTQLSYQWWFNGQSLIGKTSTNLVLTNLGHTNAGPYWVVVSNTSGSVTSAPPAQLTVYDACVDIHMYAGLNISGQSGSTYVLSYTTNLGDTNSWVPMATNMMGSSDWFYLDMDSPFSPHRFYQVNLQP